MKKLVIGTLFFTCGLVAACSSGDQAVSTTTATPSPTVVAAVATPTPTPSPAIVKTENKTHADGSEIVVKHHADGSKHEHRTFKKGPLAEVKRQTAPDGTATAHVVHRDDAAEVKIHEKTWVEKAMHATGHALAKVVTKTKEVGEKVETEVKKDVKGLKKGGKEMGEEVKKAVKN